MIRDLGERVGRAVLEGVGRVAGQYQETRPLPADLLENDEEYLAVFDAPGASREDVDVRFDRDAVHVRVERFREFHEGFELRVPGRGMSLDGTVRLPAGAAVDPDRARAVLTDAGTLEVHLPKTEREPIAIDAGGEEVDHHPDIEDRTVETLDRTGDSDSDSGSSSESTSGAENGDGAGDDGEDVAQDRIPGDDDRDVSGS